MGCAPRVDVAGGVYRMLNRANRRARIFKKECDYEAFEPIIAEALDRSELELFSYCLMPNQWCMVVRPLVDARCLVSPIAGTHAHASLQRPLQDGWQGHLYQGRCKSFAIQADEHLFTVCRYVERNAYTAKLRDAAEDWRWGSLFRWKHGTDDEKSVLSKCPITRRPDWAKHVTMAFSSSELKQLEWSEKWSCAFGDESWAEMTARKDGPGMTMRSRGRPPKAK